MIKELKGLNENERRENIDYYRRIIQEDHGEVHIKTEKHRKEENEDYDSKQARLNEIERELNNEGKAVNKPGEYASKYEYFRENPKPCPEVREEKVMQSIEKEDTVESSIEMDRLNRQNDSSNTQDGQSNNTQDGQSSNTQDDQSSNTQDGQSSNTQESKKNDDTNEVAYSTLDNKIS
jgi:hypothetical protein